MNREEYEWHVKLIQERYQYLNLTFSQAEKYYASEQDKIFDSPEHYLTVWEEWDYEMSAFRHILDEDQQELYNLYSRENVKQYEERLVEEDDQGQTDIAYNEELVTIYETHFIQDFKLLMPPPARWLPRQMATKIQYLKGEYKRFVDSIKSGIITNHFRQYRTFKPNTLKALLLYYKQLCIFPNYFYFKEKMDEPTRSIAQYVETKIPFLTEEIETVLKRKPEELKNLVDNAKRKHYGEIGGWHVSVAKLTAEEERINLIMALLLMDENRHQ